MCLVISFTLVRRTISTTAAVGPDEYRNRRRIDGAESNCSINAFARLQSSGNDEPAGVTTSRDAVPRWGVDRPDVDESKSSLSRIISSTPWTPCRLDHPLRPRETMRIMCTRRGYRRRSDRNGPRRSLLRLVWRAAQRRFSDSFEKGTPGKLWFHIIIRSRRYVCIQTVFPLRCSKVLVRFSEE